MRFSDNLPPMTDDEFRECVGGDEPDIEAKLERQDFDRKYREENEGGMMRISEMVAFYGQFFEVYGDIDGDGRLSHRKVRLCGTPEFKPPDVTALAEALPVNGCAGTRKLIDELETLAVEQFESRRKEA